MHAPCRRAADRLKRRTDNGFSRDGDNGVRWRFCTIGKNRSRTGDRIVTESKRICEREFGPGAAPAIAGLLSARARCLSRPSCCVPASATNGRWATRFLTIWSLSSPDHTLMNCRRELSATPTESAKPAVIERKSIGDQAAIPSLKRRGVRDIKKWPPFGSRGRGGRSQAKFRTAF
jgi:hypothetical protein